MWEQLNTFDEASPQEIEDIRAGTIGVSQIDDPYEASDGLVRPERAMSLREIGDVLGVSPERVRQIEKRALWKLRRGHRKRALQDYAEE